MSTTNTPNRNYVFPLKDEDLESSNNLLLASFNAIDSDVHTLVTEKANSIDVDLSTEVDTKIATAVGDFGTGLDIYGTYENGDVNTDLTLNNKLLLKDIGTPAGWTSRVNVNEKGQVIGTDDLSKVNISDFAESEYVHITGTETITGDKTFSGVVNLSGGSTIPAGDIFDDASNVSTTKGWTADKIYTEVGLCVLTTAYTDAIVLSKAQNASVALGTQTIADFGIIDAYTKTETDALNWAWGDITSGVPTTISGYGITDAYTKTETYTQTETDALVWDWSDITTGVPTTLSGYGITDAISINSVGTVTAGATVNVDLSLNEVHTITMDQDVTFTVSNLVEGQRGSFLFIQDATGGWTMTVPTEAKFPAAAKNLSVAAGAIDKVDYVCIGGALYCTLDKDFS